MNLKKASFSLYPFLFSVAVFIAILSLTQYLTYQQYLIAEEKEHEILLHELNSTHNEFRNILNNNITAANALAIMYKEYGTPKYFDTIAAQVLTNCQYVDAIQLTQKGIITNVYPLKGYENTLGINTLNDAARKEEAQNAMSKKHIYFAGPRKLRQDGYGILGKVPVIVNNELKGYCVVLTKLPTLKRALNINNSEDSKFYLTLTKKKTLGSFTHFKLSSTLPNPKSETVSVEVPEGDWKLQIAYSNLYSLNTFPYILSVFGLLISFLSALWIYRKTTEKKVLELNVQSKTHLLNQRINELSTIYKIDTILQDEEQNIDKMFTQVINVLPSGWQSPDACEAKITFEDKVYTSDGYQESGSSQTSTIQLADRRKGAIEIVYPENVPIPKGNRFSPEEVELLNSITRNIEIYLNKITQKEALFGSEEKFRAAFEMASIGMALVSLKGSWILVNHALCDMLGYTESELLQISFQKITPPEDLETDINALKDLVSGEKDFYRSQKRYIHKNGSIIWVNLNVATIKDKNNNPSYFVTQTENITDKVESEAKFRDLVEKSNVGVYILVDDRFVYANPHLIMESGYTEEELLGTNAEGIIYSEDIEIVRTNIQRKIAEKTNTSRYEVRIQKKDGSIIWTEIFSSATIFQGKPAIIGTIINISENKNFEIERQEIISNLTQRNRDLEQFSFIVSHNMRAPITNLLGLTYLLEDEITEDEQNTINEAIKESAIALDTVVKDVNEILKTKENLPISKVDVNLEQKVEKVKNILHSAIPKTDVKITTDFSQINTFHSVPAYVQSIFLNLISNSIKYGKDDTPLKINIWSEQNHDTFKIYFEDNGIGIDLKKHGDQIFSLYKKFNHNKEGKGMGLFMVKTQVHALDGIIEVMSEPNKGTTFTITFPLS